jgi:hypothetical protein
MAFASRGISLLEKVIIVGILKNNHHPAYFQFKNPLGGIFKLERV